MGEIKNMNEERYNLNWHDYSDHVKGLLNGLLASEKLTDVTLVCDDNRQLHAHKLALSACSSVFKNILNDFPAYHKCVIYLTEFQYEDIKQILDLVYLGEIRIQKKRTKSFLDVAHSLGMKEVVNTDHKLLKSESNSKFVCNQCNKCFTKVSDLTIHILSNC